MTLTVRIKVVPDNAPNAPGTWIDIDELDALDHRLDRWSEAMAVLQPYAPSDHHIVQYEFEGVV